MITPGKNTNQLEIRPSIKANPGFFSLNSWNSRSRSKHSQGQPIGGFRSFEAGNENQSYNNHDLDKMVAWSGFKQKRSNQCNQQDSITPVKTKHNGAFYQQLPTGMKKDPSGRSIQSFGLAKKLERNESIGSLLMNLPRGNLNELNKPRNSITGKIPFKMHSKESVGISPSVLLLSDEQKQTDEQMYCQGMPFGMRTRSKTRENDDNDLANIRVNVSKITASTRPFLNPTASVNSFYDNSGLSTKRNLADLKNQHSEEICDSPVRSKQSLSSDLAREYLCSETDFTAQFQQGELGSTLQDRRNKKLPEKKTPQRYVKPVNYDRQSKNKVIGRKRQQLEPKVIETDKKIQAFKDQLKNDKSLTAKQKQQIRNKITAQVSRIRQKVELANQEDAISNLQGTFTNLTKLLSQAIQGQSRKACIELLEAELGVKSSGEAQSEARGSSSTTRATQSQKDDFCWLNKQDNLMGLMQRYMGFE